VEPSAEPSPPRRARWVPDGPALIIVGPVFLFLALAIALAVLSLRARSEKRAPAPPAAGSHATVAPPQDD
jgi:hypothetical protein